MASHREICVSGRKREGVGSAAEVKQRSLGVKTPPEVVRLIPASVCVFANKIMQLALGDLF